MIGVAAGIIMVPNPGPAATVTARKNWSGGWKLWADRFSNHSAGPRREGYLLCVFVVLSQPKRLFV